MVSSTHTERQAASAFWGAAWFAPQPAYGFRSGDSNLYRYVMNDPTNATDPSGLKPANALVNPGASAKEADEAYALAAARAQTMAQARAAAAWVAAAAEEAKPIDLKNLPKELPISPKLLTAFAIAWSQSFRYSVHPDSGEKRVASAEQGGTISLDVQGQIVVRRPAELSFSPGTFDPNLYPRVPKNETELGSFHTHPFGSLEGSYLGLAPSGGDIQLFAKGELRGSRTYMVAGNAIYILVVYDREKAEKTLSAIKDKTLALQNVEQDRGKSFPEAAEIAAIKILNDSGIALYKAQATESTASLPAIVAQVVGLLSTRAGPAPLSATFPITSNLFSLAEIPLTAKLLTTTK